MPEWLASQKMWGEIFVVGVPIAEKILRPALVYVFLVVALRVFGKRELAQLNPFDLVVLLSLSNTVQNAIIGNGNSFCAAPERRRFGHRGGFETVAEVARCILHPGGTFDVKGITPPLEKQEHDEVM